MVHVIGNHGFFSILKENISGTCATPIQDRIGPVNGGGQTAGIRASRGCSFVVADWREGAEPFCGAPTRRSSSYCAAHQPICVIPHDSAAGRSCEAALAEAAEATPPPPPELAYLAESVLPEPMPDDAGEFRTLLDHSPPERGASESE